METSPIGILVLDRLGRITYANAFIQALANMSQDQLYHQTADSLPWDLFSIDGEPCTEGQGIDQFITSSGRPVYDLRFMAQAADGRRLLLSANAAPLLNQSGQADAVVVALEDITASQQVEERLRASLQEKEVLLQEIHHRVKNNLQVISSLLDMQSFSIQSPEAIAVLEDSQHRVRTMAFVHERLYQSEDLASVDVREYLESLTGYLLAAYEHDTDVIHLNLQADDVSFDIDSAIACGLIVNELVSNALKHAFPPGQPGEIHVRLRTANVGRFQLVVADNGVGFPPDLDVNTATSLGLRLVNMLTEQLQGTLEMTRDDGTIFRITFPRTLHIPSERLDQE
jgi:PAS domain S-box-containing protein